MYNIKDKLICMFLWLSEPLLICPTDHQDPIQLYRKPWCSKLSTTNTNGINIINKRILLLIIWRVYYLISLKRNYF